jgi:hypothetical protein
MTRTVTDEGHDRSANYVQASPYSNKRLLEPPRVYIPPPDLDYENGKPSFHVSSIPFVQTSHEYGNPAFLKALNACHQLHMSHTMHSWQYEMRRTAQPILPFLWLGPSSIARDSNFVKRHDITLLVAVRRSSAVLARSTFLDPSAFASSAGLASMTFDFEGPHDFLRTVRLTIRAINDHLEATIVEQPVEEEGLNMRGKALIFCESGNDRSPVLVAAYLIIVFGITAISAIHVIQSQRFCITMSDEMKNMLLDLEQINVAERQVLSSNNTARPFEVRLKQQGTIFKPLQKPNKRCIDDVYDSDEDMFSEPHQRHDAGIRQGVAPFADILD